MSSEAPRIFLDVSALKASRDAYVVLVPTKRTVQWGTRTVESTVHVPWRYNQNAELLNADRHGGPDAAEFRDRSLHRFVARLARESKVELLISDWLSIESWGVPGVGDYYGAPIHEVEAPLAFQGVLESALEPHRDHVFEYLQTVAQCDTRLAAIARKTGGFQGVGRYHRRGLFDAAHLWAAEHAGADYFLTHDAKLVRHLRRQKFVSSVIPIGAKALIIELVTHHPSWCLLIAREVWRWRRASRKRATLGDWGRNLT